MSHPDAPTPQPESQTDEPVAAVLPEALPIADADALEARLVMIRDHLRRQDALLSSENYDAFDAGCVELEPHLQAVTSATCHITEQAFAHIKDIRDLHHRIGLKLADQSAKTAKALDRVRAGKNMVKAYKT